MTLEFLTIGCYQQKEMWLQHITKMINVELQKGDSYNDLFKKTLKHFDGKIDELKAVNEWIELNKDAQDDVSVFETEICNEDCYASFNLCK